MNTVRFHDNAGQFLKSIAIILFTMFIIRLGLIEVFDIGDVVIFDVAGISAVLNITVVVAIFIWPVVSCFFQLSLQHAHETMGLGVIVNGRPLTSAPANKQKIELSVASIDEVPSIPATNEKPNDKT